MIGRSLTVSGAEPGRFTREAQTKILDIVRRASPDLEQVWLRENRRNRAQIRKSSGALLAACTKGKDRARRLVMRGQTWSVLINLYQAKLYPPPPVPILKYGKVLASHAPKPGGAL